jgi:Tol biopolymer transport system component
MQADSVRERLTLDPPVSGTVTVQGAEAWFVPNRPLSPDITYTARLAAGARSEAGRETRADVAWVFTVHAPSLAYIAPATGGPPELWRAPLDGEAGSTATALTQTGGKVFDFAVSPTGEAIIYSAFNNQDGIDLWLLPLAGRWGGEPDPATLLVDCGADRCSVPAWSPVGDRVAFSREEVGLAPGTPHGPPRVWTVSVATGQAAALYVDSQILGYGPTWSPDGKRLAFFDGSVGGIRVLDITTSEEMVLPSWMGLVGAFSPDGQSMFFNDVRLAGEQVEAVLYLARFANQAIETPFGENAPGTDYGVPAWSPQGDWLAVSLRTASGGPGKELWLMRPDGSEARPIASDPAYTYGSYRWDPWGQNLVIQRVSLGTPFPKPEIVVWNMATDEIRIRAVDATLAHWLP